MNAVSRRSAMRRQQSVNQRHITPVLRGMYSMRGTVDETYHNIEKNMVPSQAVKRLGNRSMSRTESGTCNLCSAPCSSCMHRTMTKMRSKTEEFSDETYGVSLTDHYSIDEGKALDSSQYTPTEASNLVSVSSNRDSLSEKVESKAIMRPYNVSDASEGRGTQRTLSDKYEGSKGAEVHNDSISCVSRASDSNVTGNYCEKDLDSKSVHCNSASISSLGSEESGRVTSPSKLDFSQLPFVKAAGTSSYTPEMQSQQLHPPDSKLLPVNMPEISAKIHLKSEPETQNDNEDRPGEAFRCSDDNEQDKINTSIDLPHKGETPLQVAPGDESEESDIMEHDVKVCDICGDAGREELLAICSKCSDGAEHTYCMREMLQKLPEGYWLCEECQLTEETEYKMQDAEGKEKTSYGSSMQILGKRCAENLDFAPAPKRQVVETNVGSSKISSPKRIAALSRESSFKSVEKVKMRSSSQNSSGNHSSNDVSETLRSPLAAARMQTSKSALLKSNSFGAFSSKPKVKLVEDVPQKQKGAREYNAKEEPAIMMGKLKSFRSASFGRLNVAEPKVKMLSPKRSHVHDLKGVKQVKEGSSFERENVTKLDRSSSAISTLKADQKLTPRVEVTFHSTNNNRESKVVQLDGKRSTLSRSDSYVTRKGIENAVGSVGASPINGIRNSYAEKKSNKLSMKEEPSVSSSSTERLSNSVDEVRHDGFPQLLNSSDHCEKTREKLTSCSSKVLPYQKGREPSHIADHVSSSISEASAIDVSATRNAIEDENKGCKLKAAIEAATLLKPGIYVQALQDQSLVTNKFTVEAPLEGNLQGQTTMNNMKQITAKYTDVVASIPYTGAVVMSDSSHASGSLPAVFKISAIPEHEYIWLGDFEVHRNGKAPILCGGVQAHLSTLASTKVLEVVNSFGHNIIFSEVPRLSAWPTQFHYGGPKDDNIALYFFAKDLESYEKNYKGLLDRIIKNDLALKASFDGVELLVFPSNQLPEKSQWWNMLFFLWGVFRGRRMASSGSPENPCSPSSSNLSFDKVPHSMSLSVHVDDESSGNSMIKDKGCVDKVSAVDLNSFGINLNSESLDCRTHTGTQYLSSMPTSSKQLHLGMRHGDALLMQEQHDNPKCHVAEELGSSLKGGKVPLTGEGSSSLTNFPAGANELAVLRSFAAEVDDQAKVGSLMAKNGYGNQEGNLKDKINCWEFNNPKRPYLDLSQEEQPVSVDGSQVTSEVSSIFAEGKHAAEKLNTGFGTTHGSYRTGDMCAMVYGSPIEQTRDKICEEKIILEDLGDCKRRMFPACSDDGRDLWLGENNMQWKQSLLKDENRHNNDIVPNLELGLGAETRLTKKETWPFIVGMADKDNQGTPSTENKEDEESASLSLSLSFPSASMNNEGPVKPIPKAEHLKPHKRHVNTSMLFGGFPDK